MDMFCSNLANPLPKCAALITQNITFGLGTEAISDCFLISTRYFLFAVWVPYLARKSYTLNTLERN
jgi:hypothetical protein